MTFYDCTMTFYDFLNNIRPLVKASGLEQLAGLPKNTLGKHYRWADGKPNGQACHQKHFPNIVRALCAIFGSVKIDGLTITADPDGPAIFAVRPIEGRDVECVGNFEYKQHQWRQVFDDLDFALFFL